MYSGKDTRRSNKRKMHLALLHAVSDVDNISHVQEKKIQKLPTVEQSSEPENLGDPEHWPTFVKSSTSYVALSAASASRLLHPNPVCFLTTQGLGSISVGSSQVFENKLNVMTLSWLCPANNYGGFVFVIHKTRFSSTLLLERGTFVLSVAHAGQRKLVLACGKFSGRTHNKFDGSIDNLFAKKISKGPSSGSGAVVSAPLRNSKNSFAALGVDASDNDSDDSSVGVSNSVDRKKITDELVEKIQQGLVAQPAETMPDAIEGTVAHMSCRVLSHSDAADAGHWLIVAQIEDACVHPDYWNEKIFEPRYPHLPPLLKFLGSQKFGFITSESSEC